LEKLRPTAGEIVFGKSPVCKNVIALKPSGMQHMLKVAFRKAVVCIHEAPYLMADELDGVAIKAGSRVEETLLQQLLQWQWTYQDIFFCNVGQPRSSG
jgi:hypothetical protein